MERIGEQAKAIGEKVLTQGELLQALETDIEAVQEHLDNTNTRLKQIVKEVCVTCRPTPSSVDSSRGRHLSDPACVTPPKK